MRVNEFIAEGITDNIRGSMYRNLGIGGAEGNEIAAKNNFVKRFKQQVNLNQKAGKKAGGFSGADLQQMVDSYLSQYGWVANSSDRQAITNFIQKNDIDALANQMYLVGSKQMRDPKTGSVIDPSKLNGTGNQNPAQPELNNVTKNIIGQIDKFSGSTNLDDLEQIAKHAMQRLYKMSPSSYQKLYKEVMTGQSKATPAAQPQQSVPGFKIPAKGTPEYFDAKRSLAAQKARATMVPK